MDNSNIFLSKRVLLYEALGFVGACSFIWIDEYFDLPTVLFNAPPSLFNWKEALFESGLVLILGLVTLKATSSLFTKMQQMERLLSSCCSCKKIRDDDGSWKQVESYIEEKAQIKFTHGICPDCAKRLYPDVKIYEEDET